MTAGYRQRAAQHAVRRDAGRRRSTLISRLRLLAFLAGVACLFFASRMQAEVWYVAALACFVAFATLVVRHIRVEERIEWHETLRVVNERAIARIERRWDALPPGDVPAAAAISRHAYAVDLDLFGRASLFQLLGPAATALVSKPTPGTLSNAAASPSVVQSTAVPETGAIAARASAGIGCVMATTSTSIW